MPARDVNRRRRPPGAGDSSPKGFSLIEMVVVIMLLGILGAAVGAFIARPVEGYRDLARRAALVDAAESALRRMERDLRNALPNSVRVSNLANGFALEMIPILDGARYSIQVATGSPLTFNSDDQFDVLGCFRNPATLTTSGIRLVVNNRGTGSNDVYPDAQLLVGAESLITPATGMTISFSVNPGGCTRCTTGCADRVTLSPAHDFRADSPTHRLYVVTKALTYICNTTAGTLMRYADYAIPSSQPTDPSAAPLATAASARVADKLTACSVATTTADVRNRGMATITLTLSEESEPIRLIHQVPLDNSR